ncbi:uncharacterized protein LOC116616218 [Nematostella vectensis]|uniref:uncharacterized protein LOC116616218 n=1 Tax=Nematostella vectensis TaxID=45351 RepID=UPI002077799B|nr:uncharacterized protein LOC116616218 [Nematostella vectensis]
MPFRLRRALRSVMGGGGSHHETHYTYVDRTAEILAEQRRLEQQRLEQVRLERERQEQERIAREAREAAERERQRFLAEQKRIKEAEEAAERERQRQKELQRQRELERQRALESESANKRQALKSYRFGDKTSTSGIQGVAISDIKKLRIGVFGPTGSGKSCFINTCERTVRQTNKGSVPIATTGSEGTIFLEDYLQELFFRLVDTRGFFSYDHHEDRELKDILFGRIRSGDVIRRGDSEGGSGEKGVVDGPFDSWLHGVVLVVKANDVRLKNGTLEKYLKPLRDTLGVIDLSPVTVVTHRDVLTSQATTQALNLASKATGSSQDHTFFVSNYCPDNPGPDVHTELQIFNILQFVLVNAEKYAKKAKVSRAAMLRQELQQAIEKASTGDSNATAPRAALDVFLEVMKNRHQWPESSILKVSSELQKEDVKTLHALAACWSDIKAVFPQDMRSLVEGDLRKMRMI